MRHTNDLFRFCARGTRKLAAPALALAVAGCSVSQGGPGGFFGTEVAEEPLYVYTYGGEGRRSYEDRIRRGQSPYNTYHPARRVTITGANEAALRRAGCTQFQAAAGQRHWNCPNDVDPSKLGTVQKIQPYGPPPRGVYWRYVN